MAREQRQQRIVVVVVLLSLVAIVGLAIGFALVVSANRPESKGAPVVTYDSYRTAWESAMAKASVETTFPLEPVPLADLQAYGMHTFSATFTAEEISALLTMHPFSYELNGGTVSLQLPVVGFPAAGRGSFEGYLVYGGTRYKARTDGPVTYEGGDVVVDSGAAELTVEGFGVGGDKRDQALGLVGDYLSALIGAAPQLTIESARIVDGGVEVEGMAPDSIVFPEADVVD